MGEKKSKQLTLNVNRDLTRVENAALMALSKCNKTFWAN